MERLDPGGPERANLQRLLDDLHSYSDAVMLRL
jgi:hypothetical protein